MVANVRSVKETRAGDTIFDASNQAPKPLPGYQEVRSFVFAGIYPTDTSSTRRCATRWRSCSSTTPRCSTSPRPPPRSASASAAASSGLLHMEIVQERLEREFDLDLVTTVPSVEYRVYRTDGTMELVENPVAHAARR